MTDEEIIKRAAIVAEQFKGCDIDEASLILAKGIRISSEKDDTHIAIPIYYIGKLIKNRHGRSAIVKIEDDGHLSFSFDENGVTHDIL